MHDKTIFEMLRNDESRFQASGCLQGEVGASSMEEHTGS